MRRRSDRFFQQLSIRRPRRESRTPTECGAIRGRARRAKPKRALRFDALLPSPSWATACTLLEGLQRRHGRARPTAVRLILVPQMQPGMLQKPARPRCRKSLPFTGRAEREARRVGSNFFISVVARERLSSCFRSSLKPHFRYRT